MQMQEQYGRNVVGGSDRRRRDPVFDDFDGNDGDNNDVVDEDVDGKKDEKWIEKSEKEFHQQEMTLNQTKSSSGVVRCERKKQTSNESNHRQKEFEIFMAAVLLACLPLGREREVSPKTKRQTKDGDADGKNRIVRRGKGMEERFGWEYEYNDSENFNVFAVLFERHFWDFVLGMWQTEARLGDRFFCNKRY